MSMHADVFYLIIKSIAENTLTDEQIDQLQTITLSGTQALFFTNTVLTNMQNHFFDNEIFGKLDFSRISIETGADPQILDFFKKLTNLNQNFSEYKNLNFLQKTETKQDCLTTLFRDLTDLFNQISKNLEDNLDIISYSIRLEHLEAEKYKDIRVYNVIAALEEMTSKESDVVKLIRSYAAQSNLEKLSQIKTAFEKEIPDDEADFKQQALQWVKNQEARLLKKNRMDVTYVAVCRKNEKLLLSDQLDKTEKEFIQKLKTDLKNYENDPSRENLASIKEKVEGILDPSKSTKNKSNEPSQLKAPNPILTKIYKDHLKDVSAWILKQEISDEKRKSVLQNLGSIYKKLNINSTLVLPLCQSFDERVGQGSCFGYVAAWAEGLLKGEGKRQVFGAKPNDEPLFKIADYTKMNSRIPELNHVFFSTENINRLQVAPTYRPKSTPKIESSSKKITRKLVKKENDELISTSEKDSAERKNKIVNALITQAESDHDSNIVYHLNVFNDSSGHAIGLWRNNEGVYHLLDANFGWFRCDNVEQFKIWFQNYLFVTNYLSRYIDYNIYRFRLENKQNIFQRLIEFIQKKLSLIFKNPISSEVPSEQKTPLDLPTKKETQEATENLSELFKKYVLGSDAPEQIEFFENELSLNLKGLALEESQKSVGNNLENLESRRQEKRYDLEVLTDQPTQQSIRSQNLQQEEKNIKTAIFRYQLAADRGDAEAQYTIANYYKYGIGVKADLKKAIDYSHRAADQGHSKAAYNLGMCYKNGAGVEKNLEKALKYLNLAKTEKANRVANKILEENPELKQRYDTETAKAEVQSTPTPAPSSWSPRF